MRDSREVFWNESSILVADRSNLKCLLCVCAANVVILLSLVFDFPWWLFCPPVSGIIFALVYLFTLWVYKMESEKKSNLFNEGIRRLEDWRDYYEGKTFMKGYKHPPLSNGDYFLLYRGEGEDGEAEYMRLEKKMVLIGMECFSIPHYNIKLRLYDIVANTVVYSGEENGAYIDYSLWTMVEKIQKDDYRIVALYNKYGDIKWSQEECDKKPSKFRRCVYNIVMTIWYIVAIISIFLPLIYVFKSYYHYIA